MSAALPYTKLNEGFEMHTLSVCMIVKNEEEVLSRCLASAVQFADEVVVVDTGSVDKTKQIARQYTEKVYDFAWQDDFAKARNFAFSKGTCDYLMWLDADDVVTPENVERIRELKRTMDGAVDLVMMQYRVAFDAAGHPTFAYERERIVKRSAGFVWEGAVHEVIAPAGRILHSDIAIEHRKEKPGDPDRNLRIYQAMVDRGEALEPRAQYYYARELYYHAAYQQAADVFEAFLAEGRGWVENNIGACQDLSLCYHQLGKDEKALQALLRSFVYDAPRAETCCELGHLFYQRRMFETAAFWYQTALARPMDLTRGFVQPDCYGYIPYIQLCLCYDAMGQWEKAAAYNEKAAAYKPDDASVAYNRAYFAQKRAENALAQRSAKESV